MPRRSFRSRMLERHGRQTFWFSALAVDTVLAAASIATLISSLNAAALALRPFTIVRTRGYVNLLSDQQIATEAQSIAYGEIVVSDVALAAGVASVPTPITDSQSNWHVFEGLANRFILGTAVGFMEAGRERIIDSKAMRKVAEGQDIITVAETTAISDGVIVSSFSRVLIKLH